MKDESLHRELIDLAFAVCDGVASDEQIERIEQLLADDPAARLLYLQCVELHLDMDRHVSTLLSSPRTEGRGEDAHDEAETKQGLEISEPKAVAFPIIIDPSPSVPYPLSGSLFPLSGFAFSYGVATVLLGIAILIAWASKMPVYQEVAKDAAHQSSVVVHLEPEMVFVGRVTGMSDDCQWADPNTEPFNGARVPLGRMYALAAGLVEITYDAGAHVILQGPCTYKVESRTGGYLSVGRLTARLTRKAEGGRGKAEDSRQASIHNHQHSAPKVPSSPFPLPPSAFVVRTPTAIVTDLGTEFGVEVSQEGRTTSHVFRGTVQVQVISADGMPEGDSTVLRENQTARVDGHGASRVIMLVRSAKKASFVREIPKRTLKIFDLVDVVAGGNGSSGRRDRGIDPTNGQVVNVDTGNASLFASDGKYHRVEGLPFVDGVFVPGTRNASVQLDSAGHTFGEFNNSEDRSNGLLWAGGKVKLFPPLRLPNGSLHEIPTVLADVDYSLPPHGLLFLHANKGITFDLEAIRQANPGCKLLSFRAMTGNTEIHSRLLGSRNSADLWVFMDGRECFKRRGINGYSGAAPAVVPISEGNRYLTLVGTDGGDGTYSDWIVFGDPRIEMICDAKPSPGLVPNTPPPIAPKSKEARRK